MSTTPHDDGGPAFPIGPYNGMSLRDYFAARAMAAMVAGHRKHTLDSLDRGGRCDPIDFSAPSCESVVEDDEANAQIMAETAYQVADAMLAARKGGAK